jgi:cellulose synthase/poly-beta-1,6-N-acetylglucosamine synthase-like glycosyltransferase
MRFVTDVGHYLFSYDGLVEEEELDFTYFWGGRTSCKRSFVAEHGLFRPEFTFGSEDIELAYRLSNANLRVVYWPRAIQYMNRPVTYAEFCRRCERQGISQWKFGQMHPDPTVADWCGLAGAEERWNELAPLLEAKQERAAELERELTLLGGTKEQASLRRELWSLYWWTFDACKVKGIVEGMHAGESIAAATA